MNLKYREGDRVKIISDKENLFNNYIGCYANIINVSPGSDIPYELEILDSNNNVIAEYLCWEEEGLQATTELIQQRADENYKKAKEIENIITNAAEFAGITKEQAYKFMDGLNK